MTDILDHKCETDGCPYFGQVTRSTSCRCHISREVIALKEIERLKAHIKILNNQIDDLCDRGPRHV